MENVKIEPREDEVKPIKPKTIKWIIPQCCREGWASCPHVAKRQKPIKKNIGL